MLTLMTVVFFMFAADGNVLHRAPLDYPRAAILKGVEGNVVVEVNVDEEGLVTDARVLSGPLELRNAALRSVLDWHFSKQLHPPAVTQVTVEFVLPKDRPSAPGMQVTHIDRQQVQHISIQGLSAPARDALTARLPVREGDEIDTDAYRQLTTEVQAFDEHLHVVLIRQRSGVTLDITPRPAQVSPPVASQIRVGGNAQQAKLIRQVRPTYPPEAKAAGIQGLVRMNAVIDREGRVKNLELVSGPAELVPAAMGAVAQWLYQTTLLNGQPVEVLTVIDVNFTLAK